jgi:hypothetical protein
LGVFIFDVPDFSQNFKPRTEYLGARSGGIFAGSDNILRNKYDIPGAITPSCFFTSFSYNKESLLVLISNIGLISHGVVLLKCEYALANSIRGTSQAPKAKGYQ